MKETNSKVRLIDLEAVQTSDIWRILSDYYVQGLLSESEDGAGDIVIERPERFYIKVDAHFGALRFFCYMVIKVEHDNAKFLESLSEANAASSSVKYSLLSNSVMAEYGIPLFGYIDHKHLLKTVEHFNEEINMLKLVLDDFLEG